MPTTLPKFGLGTWRANPGQVEATVYEAIKLGYRLIDCAPLYRNEAEVGNGIKRAIDEGLVKREELFIVTKIWNHAHRREHLLASCHKSLKDLQLDYVDLLLIHWPCPFGHVDDNYFPKDKDGGLLLDTQVTMNETWAAMEDAQTLGLTKQIGVSNFSIPELKDLLSFCKIRPAVNQVEIHPYLRQDDMTYFCEKNAIEVMAYCPLGNYSKPGQDTKTPLNDSVVLSIAEKHKCTPGQMLLAWGMHNRYTVLSKTVNPDRLRENLASSQVQLDEDDMKRMHEEISTVVRMVNPTYRAGGQTVF